MNKKPLPPKRPLPPTPSRNPARPLPKPAKTAKPALPGAAAARNAGIRRFAEQARPDRIQSRVRPAGAPRKVMPQVPAPAPRRMGPRPVPLRAAAGFAPAVPAAAGLLELNRAAAHADIASEVSSLDSTLVDLRRRSTFEDVFSDLLRLDQNLNQAVELLESARAKNYRYQADLEKTLYDTLGRWQDGRIQIENLAQQQALGFQNQTGGLNRLIQQLNGRLGSPALAASLLRAAQSQANQLLALVQQAEDRLEAHYQPLVEKVDQAQRRLKEIHWALDQLAEAKFSPAKNEDLVLAVPARWDQEGKDDPEGILFLTNRRVIFERKEKVATKKILFITTASELVHEVLIDQPLGALRSTQAENKGLFGHQDFLLVAFSERDLETAAFHLNGQDCKEWEARVRQALSGQLDAERVNAAGSLSAADLSAPLTAASLMSLQSEVNALQDEMMLQAARQELSELENRAFSLERTLAELRARGYVLEKDLEADVSILTAQWERVKNNTETTLNHETRLLGDQMSRIQEQLGALVGMAANLATARPRYMQVKSAMASAEAQADAAQATVLAQYDRYAGEVEVLEAHLEWVQWMLEALAGASFRLLATESGVAAVEAVYAVPGFEPENGILFLTDQRILWEDRVGDYELKVNVPLSQVAEVREAGEGERLVVRFGPGGPANDAVFQLAQPVAEDWVKRIGRARSGGYAADRAVPLAEAELERVRNAPRQCPSCGAAFTAPLLRGQTEILCEYCGIAVRV